VKTADMPGRPPAATAVTGFICPAEVESLPVPTDDRLWFDDKSGAERQPRQLAANSAQRKQSEVASYFGRFSDRCRTFS
jgi:hypothetical protein